MKTSSSEANADEASEFVSLLYRFLAVLVPFLAFIVAPMFVAEEAYLALIQLVAFLIAGFMVLLMERRGAVLTALMFVIMAVLGSISHS